MYSQSRRQLRSPLSNQQHGCLAEKESGVRRRTLGTWQSGLCGVDHTSKGPTDLSATCMGRQQQKPGIGVRWGIDRAGLHKSGRTKARGLSLPHPISFVCVYGLIRFGPVLRQVPRLRELLYLLPCCEVFCSYIDSPYCFPSGTLVIFFFLFSGFLISKDYLLTDNSPFSCNYFILISYKLEDQITKFHLPA